MKAILAGIAGKPLSTLPIHLAGMKDLDAVEKAAIKVEEIDGPILLISGGKDEVWTSAKLSQMVIDRLESRNHPYRHERLDYEDAGHSIGLPYRPSTVEQLPVFSGTILPFGGSPADNAKACADSWPRVLEFLGDNLEQ